MWVKSSMSYCGDSFSETSTNGKERIKMEGNTSYINTYDQINSPYGTKARFHYIIRPYKKQLVFGIGAADMSVLNSMLISGFIILRILHPIAIPELITGLQLQNWKTHIPLMN